MWLTVFSVCMSTATGVIVAYIGYLSNKQKKANDADRKHREEVEKRHAEEKFLQMQMIDANLDLAYVTSLAVTGGKTNGNVEAAQRKAREAKAAYYKFINHEFAEESARIV